MRYRLRTLLILMALGPILLAGIAYAVVWCLGGIVVTSEWR
jgi:hypothetical protein